MKFKLIITSVILTLVTVSAFASYELTNQERSPIEYEMHMLTMSPAEHMATKVLQNHPLVLLYEWVAE